MRGHGFSLNFFRHTSILICKEDCAINCGAVIHIPGYNYSLFLKQTPIGLLLRCEALLFRAGCQLPTEAERLFRGNNITPQTTSKQIMSHCPSSQWYIFVRSAVIYWRQLLFFSNQAFLCFTVNWRLIRKDRS